MPTEFNLDEVKIYFKPRMPWYKKIWYIITFRWNKIPKYKELKKEIWKDVVDYEGLYQVSNYGNIKSLKRKIYGKNHGEYEIPEKICKPSFDTHGYKQIVLTKNKKRKSFKVHRLVALAFIPNPNNLPQINHKDENKTNNNIDNLEWCTHIYNSNYGTRTYRCTRHLYRKIRQLDINGNMIKTYNSLQDAEKATNIKYQNISMCLNKKIKTAGGYKWKYC